MLLPLLFFFLLGCLTSWLVIHLCLLSGMGLGSDADSQHHHTHTGVIPRVGGLGMVMGFALTYLLCFIYLDDQDNKSLIHYGIFVGAAAHFFGFCRRLFILLELRSNYFTKLLIMAYQFGLSIEQVAIPFTDFVIQFDSLACG